MQKSFFITFILSAVTFLGCNSEKSPDYPPAPFPCEEGMADGQYPCEKVDLFAHITIEELTNGNAANVYLNDIWGWTDPKNGDEYVLVGLTNGVSFLKITDPENPEVLGFLPESSLNAKYRELPKSAYPACNVGIGDTEYAKSLTQGTVWRDLKVFDNHVFIVSDAQPHGIQVFDLTKLRQHDGSFQIYTQDALYEELGSAHNIIINEESGFAYAAGVTNANLCGSADSSGLHIVDISDPLNPQFAGCYIDTEPERGPYSVPGYIHDAQCVNYNGPDTEHAGKEVCFNSAEGNVLIADVSDKQNPVTLGYKRVPDMWYSHQGWLTEDQSYFLMNDELDEVNIGRTTKTYIWDVRDLENPEFMGYYDHETQSIDHNLYIKKGYAYESNYNSGLQILDLSGIKEANLEKVAFFDTQPVSDAADFNGTWSNYPFFNSGITAVSDIESGIFLLRPRLK